MFGMFYSISLAQIWGVYQEGCRFRMCKVFETQFKTSEDITHSVIYN